MIVATTPAVVPSEASAPGDAREPAQDVAADGGTQATFGKKLQVAIARPADARDATKDAQRTDPADEATTGVGIAIPTELVICGAAVPPPDDADATSPAKADATPVDAGADLAAQLALVSQWAGIAPTPATTPRATDPTEARGAVGVDPLGLSDKLAVLRNELAHGATTKDAQGANAKADAATRDAERLPVVAAAAPAVATNLLATNALKDAVERTVAAIDTPSATGNASVAASLLHLTPASTTDTSPATVLREAVGSPTWAEEFGRATVHIATTNLKEASLRLNPEHLGPLDVRVRIDDGVAHLNFQASHVDTRHALEASRPVLDHLFANQGLSIGNYSVDDRASGDAFSRQAAAGADGSGSGPGRGRNSPDASSTPGDATLDRAIASRLAKPLGLVDTFA